MLVHVAVSKDEARSLASGVPLDASALAVAAARAAQASNASSSSDKRNLYLAR